MRYPKGTNEGKSFLVEPISFFHNLVVLVFVVTLVLHYRQMFVLLDNKRKTWWNMWIMEENMKNVILEFPQNHDVSVDPRC